jgi:hypothetical protein
MKKAIPAKNPDAYVAALSGWQRNCVETLRTAVTHAAPLDETIKWGHIVYFSNGPVLLIRAEETRVLFGFWRGKRLQGIEPRLKPGGKYELATMQLVDGTNVDRATVTALVQHAVALNTTLGNPTDLR